MRYLLIALVILGLWGYLSFPTGYDKRAADGLPYIPIDKTTPRQQAEYITQHYWDSIDLEVQDFEAYPDSIAKLLEQYFSFASTQPESIYRTSLTLPLEHLSDNHLLQALTHYRQHLYRLGSPYHNEEAYRYALSWALQGNRLHPQAKAIVDSLRQRSERSALGKQAPDVMYMTGDGTLHRISHIHAPYTIIAFSTTHGLIPQGIYDNKHLLSLGQAKRLRILCLYPQGHETEIEAMPIDSLHPWVERGYDIHGQAWAQHYDIQANPEYYLIDKAQRICYRSDNLMELSLHLQQLSNKSL